MNSICNGLMLFAQNAADKGTVAEKEIPWFQNIYVLLVAALLAVAIAILIGHFVSKNMRSSEYLWRTAVIFGSILLAGVVIVGNWPPRFGIDLKGGSTFIAQILPDDQGQQADVGEVILQLKKRIDPSGVYEIVLRPLGKDKIEIIIPDVNNEEAERIWNRVTKTGFLQFMIVADSQFTPHNKAQRLAKEQATKGIKGNEVYELTVDENGAETKKVIARWVELGRIETDSPEVKTKSKYVAYKVTPSQTELIRDKRTGRIIDWNEAFATGLKFLQGQSSKDRGLELDRWAKSTANGKEAYQQLEILMMTDQYNVQGKDLSSASMTFDSLGRPSVAFNLTSAGSRLFGKLTSANKPDDTGIEVRKKQLGIVLDNQLLSAPTINSQITSRGVIEGDFNQEEVKDLVAILKAGRLKAAIAKIPVAQDKIESSIGREMKSRGLWAIGISFVAVLAFMAYYYKFSGIVSCLALIANVVLTVALVMSIKFPFSLTGLAGLVLTLGMSVDANVLIFERMREEIEKGSTLRFAIRNGFAKATTTIVDANLTTLITAVILYVIGSEMIKGFAVVLILGILMGMFTAVFCSRVLFDFAERNRWITKLNMARIIGSSKVDFVNMRITMVSISLILILIGAVAMFGRGSTILGQDMRGGSTARVVFAQPPQGGVEYVREQLIKTFQEKLNDGIKHEIEVSEVKPWAAQANGGDEDFPAGTVFKVNTDLGLSEDEADGEQSSLQLQDLIYLAFGDQLSMRGFQFTSVEAKPIGGTVPGNSTPQSAPERSDEKQGVDVSKDGTTGEAKTAEQGKDENSTPDSKAAEKTDTTDDKVDSTSDCVTQEESQDAEEKGDGAQSAKAAPADETQKTPAGTEENSQEGSKAETTPTPVHRGQFDTSAVLKFNYKISAEAVANTLKDGAAMEKIFIEVDPVKFKAEGFVGELTFPSKEWTVVFRTNTAEEGARVLGLSQDMLKDKPYFQSLSAVGSAIAGQTQLQALAAIIASLIGIVAYIWIRFQKVSFAVAAVVALIHDVLFVLGAIAISSWLRFLPGMDDFKITLPVIAAFLTLIGYSLNDTIVVFDRIRETEHLYKDKGYADMINRSIGQTLSRTILTSFTTWIVVFILFIIGGDTIHGFAFALVVGIIVGTYSSIFIASPVLLWLMGSELPKVNSATGKPAIGKSA